MDWLDINDDHPWCNGRVYANADGRTKSRCLRRPPPHWWILRLAGAVAPWEYLNTDHVLPLWRVAIGRDPMVQWEIRRPAPPDHQLHLSWQPYHVVEEGTWYFVCALDIDRNLINATSWRSGRVEVVDDWFSFDEIMLTEQGRTPLWQAGDITVQMLVGTYERLPADSCRGDYGGEFQRP